ncbi:hypothetical protein [Streptomyces sp. HPF1205]|uniref:hypothetical protein n=1 Tax=Streptomyces sp. HPF1205 TaxID=2873262 RepID=UPI001CED8D39|nr:hypothetical protein [Streptomyces sp. HPF1205]
MPFPPSDMVAAFAVHLQFKSLEQALRKRHPALAERTGFDDSQGGMLLKVALTGGRSVALAHVRMGHAIVWAVVDPVLDSEPSVWPLNTPDDALVDAVAAHASAHLGGEPVASPWRWHESEPSEMTELADLLDAAGIRVRRVAAGNGYFAYGPRYALKLDIVGGYGGKFVEMEFPEAFVRVCLKPALGWLVDVHTPQWGGWGRLRLDRCLGRMSSPRPGLPRADVSVEEIAELLRKGPATWDMESPWTASPSRAESSGFPEPMLLEGLFEDSPVQEMLPEWRESLGGSAALDDEGTARHRVGPLAPQEITKAVLRQLTVLGFSDLQAGGAGVPIESGAFHFEWRSAAKDLSAPEIQRLNGLAAAAGDDLPKRLIVITSGGLTRPAADFADKAKAYAFRLNTATGRLTALNSLADEAALPVQAPGERALEPW